MLLASRLCRLACGLALSGVWMPAEAREQATAPAPSPAAVSPEASPAPTVPADVRLERSSWGLDIDGPTPVRRLEVANFYGDVRARFAGDRRIEASAVIQRLGPESQRLGWVIERRGDTIVLFVTPPPGRVQDSDPQPAKAAFDRLDLVVYVPEGLRLRVDTLHGLIEGRGLRGDVEARSVFGDVLVTTSAALSVAAGSGRVYAAFGADSPERPIVVTSGSGPITVALPAAPDVSLRVETGGSLSTKLAVERSQLGSRQVARATWAAGRRPVLVDSASGEVIVQMR
jgi:hypothetical protein